MNEVETSSSSFPLKKSPWELLGRKKARRHMGTENCERFEKALVAVVAPVSSRSVWELSLHFGARYQNAVVETIGRSFGAVR